MSNYYKVGGSLKYNHHTYVSREADDLLIAELQQGNYCFLFNSRQMGKSSLKVKALKELRKLDNIRCASCYLGSIETNIDFVKWFHAFASQILRSLNLNRKLDFDSWWNAHNGLSVSQALDLFFTEIVLKQVPEKKLIIFIDEVDSLINFPFKDDFFTLIRYFYDFRSENSDYERLTFCLIGVITPSDLIDNKARSPFNIGTSIELTGFKFEKAKKALVGGLQGQGEDPEALLDEIISLTGGQPYLTQKVCQLVADRYEAHSSNIKENIEKIIRKYILENWEAQDTQEHFKTIKNRLLFDELKISNLLGTYLKVLDGETTSQKVPADRNEIIDILRLSGIVVSKNNYLEACNPIYKEIFNRDWVQQQLDQIRPYSQEINQWLANNKDSKYLLEGEALQTSLEWSSKRSIGDLDREYLQASERQQNKRKSRKLRRIALVFSALALSAATLSVFYANRKQTESEISALANQGDRIAREFESDQIAGLISGIKTSDRLNQLTSKQPNGLTAYPTFSPMDNLYSAIDNISQRNILKAHEQVIKQIAYSNDEKFLATADDSGAIKLWDAKTQRELDFFKVDNPIIDLSFSSDSKQLISLDRAGNLKIWNMESLDSEPINKTLLEADRENSTQAISDSSSNILAADFNPKDRTVAVVYGDGVIKIWDINDPTNSPAIAKNYLTEFQATVYTLAYSPDGQNIVLGDSNGNIVIWNLLDDSTILKSRVHQEQVKSIVYSPNGKQIVSSSVDGVIQLRDDRGELLDTSISSARKQSNLVFSPNREILALGASNGDIELFDTSDRYLNPLKNLTHSQDKAVTSLVFNPDGEFLVTGGSDRKIKLWQLQNNLIPQIKAHDYAVSSLSISQDDSLLVSAGEDGSIALWQTKPKAIIQDEDSNVDPSGASFEPYELISQQICDRAVVNAVSVNPQNKNLIACGGVEKTIKIYNIQENEFIREIPIGDRGEITSLSHSPDGKSILTVTDPGKSSRLTLWDVDGSLLQPFRNNSSERIEASFDPKGEIIVATKGNSIEIWNINGKLINTLTSHKNEVTSISFNSQGNLLVSTDVAGKIKLWNLKGEELHSFSSTGEFAITDVTFSPDSRIIVAADRAGNINLWQLDQKNEVSFMFAIEEDSRVNNIHFTSDSKTLIVGKTDGSLSFWDLDLDSMIAKGCFWLKDYLETNPDIKLDACK